MAKVFVVIFLSSLPFWSSCFFFLEVSKREREKEKEKKKLFRHTDETLTLHFSTWNFISIFVPFPIIYRKLLALSQYLDSNRVQNSQNDTHTSTKEAEKLRWTKRKWLFLSILLECVLCVLFTTFGHTVRRFMCDIKSNWNCKWILQQGSCLKCSIINVYTDGHMPIHNTDRYTP